MPKVKEIKSGNNVVSFRDMHDGMGDYLLKVEDTADLKDIIVVLAKDDVINLVKMIMGEI